MAEAHHRLFQRGLRLSNFANPEEERAVAGANALRFSSGLQADGGEGESKSSLVRSSFLADGSTGVDSGQREASESGQIS